MQSNAARVLQDGHGDSSLSNGNIGVPIPITAWGCRLLAQPRRRRDGLIGCMPPCIRSVKCTQPHGNHPLTNPFENRRVD